MSARDRLQEFKAAQTDTRRDGRNELSDERYAELVWFCTDLWGAEATRLVLGEALRATRDAAKGEQPT